MKKRPEWFQTFFDGLYAKVLPKTFDDPTTLRQARIIKRLLKLRKGRHVLDIPCGMGRISLPLARNRIRVTGVDLTKSESASTLTAAVRLTTALRPVGNLPVRLHEGATR